MWRTDLKTAISKLERAIQTLGSDRIWVSSSCSLLHVPYTLNAEKKLNPELLNWLAFADEKLDELTLLSHYNEERQQASILDNQHFLRDRQHAKTIHKPHIQERLSNIKKEDLNRKSPYKKRIQKQQKQFSLPLYPTTTIGSFPQTQTIRKMRAQHKKGYISDKDYHSFVQKTISETIEIQQKIGLDVLVHGECERNDMVEYFGEYLNGFAITQQGWVQSYGSRIVKPPIIYGDVERLYPITVDIIKYAQSQTNKPVKAMLTGPVTILQWSFVRNDIPNETVCKQIALTLRDEVSDLEQAGIGMIQIDEPALREGLPLRKREQKAYLDWAVNAFRLASSGVNDETQIHTHMCYSEFNDIIDSIANLDADVISIETSRSQIELLDVFTSYNYPNAIGPGVYDIHSPRIPKLNEIISLLNKTGEFIDKEQIWVNPDCGLKTRNWKEVISALKVMVEAARFLRQKETLAS